ncbi:MAG: hypothetical protein DRP01_04735 [Archaeoglobales archaeon]|nr:MAG: hypothetical protein DRP01_04735 [Archaeoglobales archaeon]
MRKRKYEIVAESYLTEWLGMTYPPGTWTTNVNVGRPVIPPHVKLTKEEEAWIKRAFVAKVDAIVLLPDEVHLVECKIRNDRGKIEQLLIYEWLFKRDEDFKAHWHKKIRKILLTPKDQGMLEEFLRMYGIEVVYYKPLWIIEYLNSLRRADRRGMLSSVEF